MAAQDADAVRWFAEGLIARLHWLQHPEPVATQPENNVWEGCDHYLCREAQRLLTDGRVPPDSDQTGALTDGGES